MNFQTMNKQRKFILIAAAVGIISMFLPWFSFSGYGYSASANGMHSWGIIIFLLFAGAGAVALLGTQTLPLEKTFWFVALAAGGIAAVWLLIYFLTSLDAISVIGFGFYLSLLSALAIVYFAWTLKSPGDNFKSGFDSLKGEVNKQVNSGPANTTTTTTTNTGTPSSTNMGNTGSGNITTTPTDPTTGL